MPAPFAAQRLRRWIFWSICACNLRSTSSKESRDVPPVDSASDTSSDAAGRSEAGPAEPAVLPPEGGCRVCRPRSLLLEPDTEPGLPGNDGSLPACGFLRSRPTSSGTSSGAPGDPVGLLTDLVSPASCFGLFSAAPLAASAPAPLLQPRSAVPSLVAADAGGNSGGVSEPEREMGPSTAAGLVDASGGGGEDVVVELALECQPGGEGTPLCSSAPEANPTSCSRMDRSESTRGSPASRAMSVRLRRSLPRFASGKKTERQCLKP